jgi:hypothetical protein
MRKQLAVAALLMLLFGGMGSSALLARALAQPKPLATTRQEEQTGPRPTPRWYWRWTQWRLGEGYAKGHTLQSKFRPTQTPLHIPSWAWQRLHLFMRAREQRALALAANKPHRSHTTTTGTTGTSTSTPTTTTSSTTTTATTTTTSSNTTYDQAIAYTQTRPAFTPIRVIDVSNATELRSALANLQAGDLIEATAGFTVSGQTVIKSRLASPAVIDLSQYPVKFVYSGGSNYNAVWLNDPENVWIYGGDASTADTGGDCIKVNGADDVRWWGFTAHDCGASGFSALSTAPLTHDDFQGEVWTVGQNLAWDSHTEKGTGLHGAILWDSRASNAFSDNRFAIYAHDIPTGSCVEIGNAVAATASGNVLYEKCVNETEISTVQTGGNGLQLWGATTTLGLDVKYLEVDNAQGRAVDENGAYSGQTLSGVTIEYGRASNTNLNTLLNEANKQLPWDVWHGTAYEDVQPAP